MNWELQTDETALFYYFLLSAGSRIESAAVVNTAFHCPLSEPSIDLHQPLVPEATQLAYFPVQEEGSVGHPMYSSSGVYSAEGMHLQPAHLPSSGYYTTEAVSEMEQAPCQTQIYSQQQEVELPDGQENADDAGQLPLDVVRFLYSQEPQLPQQPPLWRLPAFGTQEEMVAMETPSCGPPRSVATVNGAGQEYAYFGQEYPQQNVEDAQFLQEVATIEQQQVRVSSLDSFYVEQDFDILMIYTRDHQPVARLVRRWIDSQEVLLLNLTIVHSLVWWHKSF